MATPADDYEHEVLYCQQAAKSQKTKNMGNEDRARCEKSFRMQGGEAPHLDFPISTLGRLLSLYHYPLGRRRCHHSFVSECFRFRYESLFLYSISSVKTRGLASRRLCATYTARFDDLLSLVSRNKREIVLSLQPPLSADPSPRRSQLMLLLHLDFPSCSRR